MARFVKALMSAVLLLFLGIRVLAQSETTLIAPYVFLRGLQLPDQVRYTASFIKPTDDMVLRNVSVEITLPPDAVFTEMLVTRQIQFDVVRVNRQGALTLIWQISRVAADTPLDSFSFTVAQPLTSAVEFYIAWQSEDGTQAVENFLELPPLTTATQSQGQITVAQEGYLLVGETGVQVLAPVQSPPLSLTTRLLPTDFNPPLEYQGIWWCSLLEVVGLPQGTTADVIVPLRRPLAPFTMLQLFQQQFDNTWIALDGLALVTADGQYAMYTHPGGIVATGVEAELQPEIKPVSEIQIQPVDLPVVVAPPIEIVINPPVEVAPITDGSSNTVIITEYTAVPPPQVVVTQPPPLPTVAPITDGSSNTIISAENTAVPTIGAITDGSSNTVIITEYTAVPPPATATRNKTDNVTIIGGTLTTPPAAQPLSTQAIIDGSSNTIIIGENTIAPTEAITDGSSNTIIIGENTAVPLTVTATGNKTDNVIIIGGTLTTTPAALVTQPLGTVAPTIGAITDGSSNTIIIGENTIVPTEAITDGSSNTIIIGESTAAPLTATATLNVEPTNKTDNVIIIGGTLTTPPVALVTQSLPTQAITDGSSNTVIIGENTTIPTEAITDGSSNTISISETTATPTVVINNQPIATLQPPSGLPINIVLNPVSQDARPQPFGAGGVRIVIFTREAGDVLQCQVGQINCAILQRTPGKGLR